MKKFWLGREMATIFLIFNLVNIFIALLAYKEPASWIWIVTLVCSILAIIIITLRLVLLED